MPQKPKSSLVKVLLAREKPKSGEDKYKEAMDKAIREGKNKYRFENEIEASKALDHKTWHSDGKDIILPVDKRKK